MTNRCPTSQPPCARRASPLLRSATGLRKRAAGANAALQAEIRDVSERVEALAASSKRREKSQALREKATALARSMEIKRIQVFMVLPPCLADRKTAAFSKHVVGFTAVLLYFSLLFSRTFLRHRRVQEGVRFRVGLFTHAFILRRMKRSIKRLVRILVDGAGAK